ncbi:MAG: hypothetical protein HN348_04290 [Proteobacteria bacterium]|nr:hypothetical protein [Pseudomonadota bacterium]
MKRVLWWFMAVITVAMYAFNVQRHYFLCDDSYISFRYAQNLIDGHGLVFNPGEAVEGYTNFLWVLIVAAGMVLRLPPEILSSVIGIGSGLGVLGLVAWFTAKRLSWDHPLIWAAPLMLASSRTFAMWSSGGLETMFFTVLVFGAILRFLHERTQPDRFWASALLLAAATLTRPEGGLFTFILGCFFLGDVLWRKRTLQHLLAWSSLWFALVGAHFLFRYATYGAWLPNTFHAKVNGLWWSQSFEYFSLYLSDYDGIWYLWLALVPLAFHRAQKLYATSLFVVLAVVYLCYVGAIGGDRFEFRFLVCIYPLVFWLIAEGIRLLTSWEGIPEDVALGLAHIGVLAVAVVTLAGGIETEAQSHPTIASAHHMRAYANRRAREGKFLGDLVRSQKLPANTRLCVGGAGAVPYYSGLYTLDYHGLSDAEVVKSKIQRRSLIAHEHRAAPAYMAEKEIHMYDVLGRLVHKHVDGPKKALARAQDRVESLNRKEKGNLVARCRYVEERFIIYASTLTKSDHQRLFGHIDRCRTHFGEGP